MDYTHIPEISCYYSSKMVSCYHTDDADYILSEPDAHFEHQMILVTNGTAKIVINEQTYDLAPKSLVFISRMERHYFIISDDQYERMVASMSNDLIMSNIREVELLSLFIQRPKQFSHVVALSDEAYEMLLPLFARLCNESLTQKAFFITRCFSIVVAILIDLYRTHPTYFPPRNASNLSDVALTAQRYINEHYAEPFTLQELAEQNYISRHTLSAAFKEIVGIPFKEYVVLFRLSEAKRLLVTTDASIGDIAEQVGYLNVNNFIKIFKEREHQTPLQYRKKFNP